MSRGCFITFEGIEGCGKTTQLGRLAEWLAARGMEVVSTREPGGTPIAEAIRALLLDVANTAMSPVCELLLYEAARAQHVDERIRPALDRGAVVLCDRFTDSTTAYQGAARQLGTEVAAQLHAVATGGLRPDLTLLFDLPVHEALARTRGRTPDRIESEPEAFHEAVRQGFLDIASDEPDRVMVVNAGQPEDAVSEDVCALVDAALSGKAPR
jgi:dTMP kinase